MYIKVASHFSSYTTKSYTYFKVVKIKYFLECMNSTRLNEFSISKMRISTELL